MQFGVTNHSLNMKRFEVMVHFCCKLYSLDKLLLVLFGLIEEYFQHQHLIS